MDNFKIKLKKRRILFIVIVIAVTALGVLDALSLLPGSNKETFTAGMMDGISWSTYIALGLAALAASIRITRMLKDEALLRKAYNKENDERLKMIRSRAGMPIILIMSILMFVVAIIFSSINETVFYTLLAAGYIQLLCAAGVKIYCLKTM